MKGNLFKNIKLDTLFKSSIKVVFLRLIGVLLLFVVTLYITNEFNADLVGQYDLSRAILFIFGSFCLLGFNQSIIYYSGFLRAKKSLSGLSYLYQKMLLVIVLVALLFLLIYILVPDTLINDLYEKDVYELLLKTFFVIGFHAFTMLNIDVYRAINKIGVSEIFRNIYRYIFFLGGLLVLVLINKEHLLVDLFLWNYVFLAIVSTAFVFYSMKKIKEDIQVEELGFKEIVLRSYPMSISLVCFLLLQSTDIILLGRYTEFDEVAHYAVAVKLTMLVSTVLYSVSAVYAPKIAELQSLDDQEQLKKEIKRSTRLIFVLTMPAILFIIFFSNYVLQFFGPGYTNASLALKILLIGQIVNAMTGAVGMYMNMSGKQVRLQIILIIALILNVVLNLILIPKYGLEGAAIATTISTIFWNIYCVAYLYFKNEIKTFLH